MMICWFCLFVCLFVYIWPLKCGSRITRATRPSPLSQNTKCDLWLTCQRWRSASLLRPRLGLVRGAAGSLAARKCFGNPSPGFWSHLAVSSNTTGAARTSVVRGNMTQKNKITLIFPEKRPVLISFRPGHFCLYSGWGEGVVLFCARASTNKKTTQVHRNLFNYKHSNQMGAWSALITLLFQVSRFAFFLLMQFYLNQSLTSGQCFLVRLVLTLLW